MLQSIRYNNPQHKEGEKRATMKVMKVTIWSMVGGDIQYPDRKKIWIRHWTFIYWGRTPTFLIGGGTDIRVTGNLKGIGMSSVVGLSLCDPTKTVSAYNDLTPFLVLRRRLRRWRMQKTSVVTTKATAPKDATSTAIMSPTVGFFRPDAAEEILPEGAGETAAEDGPMFGADVDENAAGDEE